MIIETQAVGPFFKNGYLVGCERSRRAVLIDPGDEIGGLLTFAERHAFVVDHILLTHAHVDHMSGVAVAKRALPAPVHLHRDDLFLYNDAVAYGLRFGLRVEPPPPVDAYYTTAQVIPFGACEVRPHHTPGHSPGGVCLEIREPGTGAAHLFVGDTLFAGAIGRTDLPGGDYDTLIRSIRTVLFAFGDDVEVHSGHGPATTIGDERRTNPFLIAE